MVPIPSWCLSDRQDGWSPHLCCSPWFSTFFSAWPCKLWASFWFRGSLGIPWGCTGMITALDSHIPISIKHHLAHMSRGKWIFILLKVLASLRPLAHRVCVSVALFGSFIHWYFCLLILYDSELGPSFISKVSIHYSLARQPYFKLDNPMKWLNFFLSYWNLCLLDDQLYSHPSCTCSEILSKQRKDSWLTSFSPT